MLATWDLVLNHLWDLGIMMEHEDFGLELTNYDGNGFINSIGYHITY